MVFRNKTTASHYFDLQQDTLNRPVGSLGHGHGF